MTATHTSLKNHTYNPRTFFFSSYNIHLPHLERDPTHAQLSHALDNNSCAIPLCMTTTPPGIPTQAFPKTRFDNHRMASQSQLRNRECSHRLAHLSLEQARLFPQINTGFPLVQNGPPPNFPPPTQDRLPLWLSGMRDKQSRQGSTQVPTVQTRDVPAIPEQT
jgi:hypothetical protein